MRAGEVLVPVVPHHGGIDEASFAQALLVEQASAQSRSGPRSHSPSGMPKPIFGRSTSSRGTWR